MPLKMPFLHSHLDVFTPNLEHHYQGKWDELMMSEYSWFLQRTLNHAQEEEVIY